MDSFRHDLVFDLNDVLQDCRTVEGSDGARFLFLVPDGSYTTDNVIQFKAICNAIQIDTEKEVHVVSPGTRRMIRIREINAVADHIFFMGLSPELAGFSFPCPKNQFVYIGGMYVLVTDDLSILQKNIEAKKGLWLSLKQHFIDDQKHVR